MEVRAYVGIQKVLDWKEESLFQNPLLNLSWTIIPVPFFFTVARQPLDQGLLIHEVLRSHTTMHHSR